MDNTLTWVLIGVVAGVVVVGGIFLLMPKDKYIEVDGVKVWKIPSDAEIIFVDQSKVSNVKTLVQKGQLIAFEGETQGLGTIQDREKAKIRAYQKLAEFLNAKVTTFAQLVEGQLQNVQISGSKKQELLSASVDTYKRVTELFAEGRLTGTYEFAAWKVRRDNLVYTYVLLVYDPTQILKLIEVDTLVKQKVDELGKQGVNFFGNLNAVLQEATKGTPMEKK
jgi:hypothetical protein